MKLTKAQKNKLVTGIISIVLISGTLLVKSFFTKPSKETNNTTTTNINPKKGNTSFDSSTQTNVNIEPKIENKNTGDVKNEFIGRDKIENQNNFYTQPKPEIKQPVSNDRKLNSEDINRIKNKIPLDYIVEVAYPSVDRETYDYATEIINKLESLGYKINTAMYNNISGFDNLRFRLDINEDEKRAYIWVFKLAKN